jgi:hydroxypyruvate isomerase
MPSLPLQFAANLSWLYTDLPFLDRFEAAAHDGFRGVECLFPHVYADADILARLQHNALELVLFNVAPGDWAANERGLACRLGREVDFQRSVREALARAQYFQCPRIHVMAGLSEGLQQGDAALHAREQHCYEARLRWAAEQAAQAGVTLMIEPINPIDMPGYLLTHQAQAHVLVQSIGSPWVQVQMDLYHCQRVEAQALTLLHTYLPTGRVGHLQLASVPARQEPGTGELDCTQAFQTLQQLNYTGWIGCEYRPRDDSPGGTSRGLSWLKARS